MVQNVGRSLGKHTIMTFALNVTTSAPEGMDGSLWSTFSPISKLITIASVNNKAQFEVRPIDFSYVVLCFVSVVWLMPLP